MAFQSLCWYHCYCALKHGSLPYMSFQPQPLSRMESNANPEAPDMPAGAAPSANEVPLQPLPFMSKPQLPAETGRRCAVLGDLVQRVAVTRPRHNRRNTLIPPVEVPAPYCPQSHEMTVRRAIIELDFDKGREAVGAGQEVARDVRRA